MTAAPTAWLTRSGRYGERDDWALGNVGHFISPISPTPSHDPRQGQRASQSGPHA